MHVFCFYLPVMNLGASVTITSISVMISEVATHRCSPTLGSDGSMAFFSLLLDQYVVDAEDLA